MTSPDGQEQAFTLGTVVGRLDGILREVEQSRVGGQRDLLAMEVRLSERIAKCETQIGNLRRTSGAWKWVDKIGTFIGAILSGFWAGKAAAK